MTHMNKIGFACKWMDDDPKIVELANCKTITRSWAERQTDDAIRQKLYHVAGHNVESIAQLIKLVGDLPPNRRMFRISSEILPLYTISRVRKIYDEMFTLRDLFKYVGQDIRKYGITVSFHPGQFCCLASDKDYVVVNSIDEIEYHADMARWMGFGESFQDGCKINIHIAGKLGPSEFVKNFYKLSNTARNLLTIENDEISYGLEDCLSISDHLPVVLDIHHHWIKTGEYIQPTDDRVQQVIKSWRGRIPSMHYSVSREDVLVDHDPHVKPDLADLLSKGYKKGKLRAHSEYYWNTACNEWAALFLPYFNIMCESKMKNKASKEFYEQAIVSLSKS